TWTSTVTNRLLIEAGVGYVLEDQRFQPRPESVSGRILDSGFNISYRANVSNMGAYTPVTNSRASMSYVTGSHSAKVGFTMILGTYENTRRQVGNINFGALNGVPTSVTYYDRPALSIDRVRPNLGIFGQDQWTISRTTLNLGLRFDWFRAGYP